MKPERSIFHAVFTREFYRHNASFFLLVTGLAAGFLRGSDHIALAELFTSNPLLLSIPFAVWLIYTLKVIAFNSEALKRSENEFLYTFILLPKIDQHSALLITLINQLMPAIVYGIFLVMIALQLDLMLSAAVIVIMLAALIVWATWRLHRSVQQPDLERKVHPVKRWFDRTFHKPYTIFFTEWILQRQPLPLIGFKAFSIAIVLTVCYLYSDEPYDHRLLAMGVVISATAHFPLLMELHRFENFHFPVLRQLPLKFSQRVLYTLGTLSPLMLPECGLLITYFPENLPATVLPESILLLFSVIIFISGSLYVKDRKLEHWNQRIFFTAMALIALILFSIPLPVFIIVLSAAGLYQWRRMFYRFEYISDPINHDR